ncbi:MAG: nucleoside-triphosphatase [Candidatus Uhrbacteria bacterium]
MRKNILITGMPKSGKSTLLKKVISGLENKIGFVTNEVRENGERIGFEIETHLGEKSTLASVNFQTDFRVSKFFVNVNNLDEMIPKVSEFNNENLLFLDEIGQMELFSENFKNLVLKYLDSPNTCIATIKVWDNEFIEQIKKRNDVILVEITEENRDSKEKFITKLIGKIQKAKRYASEPKRFLVKDDEVTITTDHGEKHLKKIENEWCCDCGFFAENKICSHLITFDECSKK